MANNDGLIQRIKALTEDLKGPATVGARDEALSKELVAVRAEIAASKNPDVAAAAKEMEEVQAATPYEGGRSRRKRRGGRKTKRRSTKKARLTRRGRRSA